MRSGKRCGCGHRSHWSGPGQATAFVERGGKRHLDRRLPAPGNCCRRGLYTRRRRRIASPLRPARPDCTPTWCTGAADRQIRHQMPSCGIAEPRLGIRHTEATRKPVRDQCTPQRCSSGHQISDQVICHQTERNIEAADGGSADLETRLEGTISEFTLPNGMHFIVKQRRNAPVVACHTYANVGAFDDEDGHTGAVACPALKAASTLKAIPASGHAVDS